MPRELIRTVSWRPETWAGDDTCSLYQLDGGWELDGEAQATVDGVPVEVKYTVRVDREWQTRVVQVRMKTVLPPTSHRCSLKRDEFGSWTATSGNDRPPLGRIQDLTDIDIQVTPSTNTLPVRRLNLAVGESAEVSAAWFRIPEFKLEPLRQRYTRTTEDTYRYESLNHDFTATLTVDDLGLVVNYDPGWVRLASTVAVPRR